MRARRGVWLLVGLLLAAGCDDAKPPAPPDRPPRIEDLARAPVDLAKRCPAVRHRPVYAPGGRLPAGAVFVRVCTGWVSARYARAFPMHTYDDPVDVLHTTVADLVDQANALTPPPPPSPGVRTYCSDVGGTPLEFWFAYPSGRTAVVRWEVGGCGYVRMGQHVGLTGGAELRDTFSRLLAEQRSGEQAPAVRAPRCNPSAQPLTALETSTLPPLAAATYCVLDDRSRWRAASVPGAGLRQIEREAVQGHRGAGCTSEVTFAMLRARTAFGDRVDLSADGCRWSLPYAFSQGDETPARWTPSRRLARELASLTLGPPQPQRKPDGTLAR